VRSTFEAEEEELEGETRLDMERVSTNGNKHIVVVRRSRRRRRIR
jgi:hypothetical protein